MTSEDVCDVNDKLKDEVKIFSFKFNNIAINLKGHLVVNGTYAGDLLCTGLTHW